ncbi:related to alkaline phosphatase family protein [Ramularia collo-cygni]|uniref:Related to alkaline phosphatase family protein n=1 Tax=Ramularia collo-cygni TaxID=112498 RepID=A0A2D3VLG3_9PEZI|nr:related to alkaline phosphatase family protein [Ramularia collo-cygni]CZT22063.1 related to alkaline phosphatase family protein [Ramularia collo-cygni]
MHLNNVAQWATVISSLLLRGLAFVFLRWIPGHPFPPLIYTLFATYIPAFWYTATHTSPLSVVSDRVVITEKENVPEDVVHVDGRYVDGPVADPGKELVVEEEIEVEEKDAQRLMTLLTGLPSPTSLIWSVVTCLINLVLVGMVADLVWRAHYFYPSHDLSMARVGYVSDTTAKILVREPDVARFPVFASYRLADGDDAEDAWKSAGSITWMDNRTDFTDTLTLTGLQPDSRYQYTANNHTGFFTTAPPIGRISTRADKGDSFTFVHSSCIKLNFPYNPLSHPLSAAGLKHLTQAISGLGAQFMLFLGDFIYIDVPRRKGVDLESYRRDYRQVYASPDWPQATEDLPWIHVYDDHEIANDWDKNTTAPFLSANDPYEHYHIAANPPAARSGETYFTFTQGPTTFFMLDTRRYRDPNDNTNGSDPITGEATKTMLGKHQLADLLEWLRRDEPAGVKWKIVISSVPFTKNWHVNAQDTWRGYLGERQIILEAMWDVGGGVVVLSGDRHEFAATAFPPPPPQIQEGGVEGKNWPLTATVHEFSVSPLNMFYLPITTYWESSTSRVYTSDVCLKYVRNGNSKVGAVSISEMGEGEGSRLMYRLFVDGKEEWRYAVTATPPDG